MSIINKLFPPSTFSSADVLPKNKEFDVVDTSKEALKVVECDKPIGDWHENAGSGNRADPELVDNEWNVNMMFRARFHSKNQADHSVHTEDVGEIWRPVRDQALKWTSGGASWDRRSMILHPAVAPLAVTDAGFDQAYLSALAATHQMMGQPQRADIQQVARDHLGIMIRQSISPFRLFLRGAALWHALAQSAKRDTAFVPLYRPKGIRDAKAIWTPSQFSSALTHHAEHPHDAVYVKLDDKVEAGILNAIVAMTADEFPLEACRQNIGTIWPPMKSPIVYYTAQWSMTQVDAPISKANVWSALCRLADTYDAWDLLDEALRTVPVMTHRPEGMPSWMGRSNLVWNLPESRMQAGICGPLFSGVSAQGMKTVPIAEPDPRELLVEGCIRASFILAAAGLHLTHFLDSHFALKGLKASAKTFVKNFASISYSRDFNDRCGSMAGVLGWDRAMGRSIRDIRIPTSRSFVGSLLNSSAYPSTSVLLPWLNKARGGPDMGAFMRPAIPSIPARTTGWQSISVLGNISEHEVAACIMRVAVEVRFVVKYRNGKVVRVKGPERLSVNRAMPLLAPEIRCADVRVSTQILIHRPQKFFDTRAFCAKLRDSHIVVEKLLAAEPDPEFFDADSWNDDEELGPDAEEMTPEEAEEFNETQAALEAYHAARKEESAPLKENKPPPTRTLREQAEKIEALSGLPFCNFVPADGSLQQHHLPPRPWPQNGAMLLWLDEKSPQGRLLEVPPSNRRAVATAIADFVGSVGQFSENTEGHHRVLEVQRQYRAAAAAMEHGSELTADEHAAAEELRIGGIAPVGTHSEAAVFKEDEELPLEDAAIYDSSTQNYKAADALDKKAQQGDDLSFLASASSGDSKSVPVSEAAIPETAAESVEETSALPAGTIGFSDTL